MSKQIYNSVKVPKVKRNFFDLTHDVKMSTKFGQLTPVLAMECLPGDKVTIGADMFLRFAPLISPVMHQYNAYIHYFFVPLRILNPNFETFITTEPTNPAPPSPPRITMLADGSNYTPLMDYLGLPQISLNPGTGARDIDVSAYPFAAVQKIWNEYFRSQDLQSPITIGTVPDQINLVDGTNMAYFTELTTMRNRGWERDYFTACLPFAQKGVAVRIPVEIATDAPVYVDHSPYAGTTSIPATGTGGAYNVQAIERDNPSTPTATDQLFAQTQGLTGQALIEDLRRSIQLQSFLELSARAGTRYTEVNKAHFNVRSSDQRLQRPEYIVGIKTPVMIGEVLNTGGGSGTDPVPQANMAGRGVAGGQGKFGKYYVEEHGYLMGLMSILPRTAYQQGIPKHFLRLGTSMDYPWPLFANLGEQEVTTDEIYAGLTDNDVFGYLPRYTELKDLPNRVAGDFKTSLSFWHGGRIFQTAPALNSDFIQCKPTEASPGDGNDRIFAVQNGTDYIYAQVVNKIKAVRALPMFAVPQL